MMGLGTAPHPRPQCGALAEADTGGEVPSLRPHPRGAHQPDAREAYLLSRVDAEDLDISRAALRALCAAESLVSVPTSRSLSITAILRARPQHFRAVMLRWRSESSTGGG